MPKKLPDDELKMSDEKKQPKGKKNKSNLMEPLPSPNYYKKSNYLILAKYRTTKLENNVMTMGLMNVVMDEDGRPVSKFSVSDLRSMSGKYKSNSVYSQLLEMSKQNIQRILVVEDPENHKFSVTALIEQINYDNGNIEIIYTKSSVPYLFGYVKNYTRLNGAIQLFFEGIYSSRLYEILLSFCYDYDQNGNTVIQQGKVYKKTFLLSELRMTLGCVDLSEDTRAAMLSKKADYDKLYKRIPDSMKDYKDWCDFKEDVLEKAIKEINQLSEITVNYIPIRKGRGGGVKEIVFEVTKKIAGAESDMVESRKKRTKAAPHINIPEEEIQEKIDEVVSIIKEQLTISQYRDIVMAAGGDIEYIKATYELAKEYGPNIRNITAWMVSALKNNYAANEPVKKLSAISTMMLSDENPVEDQEAYDELESLLREYEDNVGNMDHQEFDVKAFYEKVEILRRKAFGIM